MSLIFYKIFIWLYSAGAWLLSPWNKKAALWLAGRKTFPVIDTTAIEKKVIWMHCASLGEFEQGRPLLEAIRQKYPDCSIVLSFFSPSGYEVQQNYKGADHIFYLPVDTASNAKKFIDTVNPSLVLWVKYEYWFYYLLELKKRKIPTLLVSGIFRAEQPFFKWYGGLWKKILPAFSHFFVQNEISKELLNGIGIPKNVSVSGDTRFDRVIAIAEKFTEIPGIAAFCGNSKVVVAGSTWEDDEAELIHYVRANPQIKFIIAPHEVGIENLRDVKKEFTNSLFYSELITLPQVETATANCVIIDNIGMLSRLYHYAHVTYIGGGFGDGIHNVLEAAVYGKPVIFGPEHEKYAEAVDLIACGGSTCIRNALELEKIMNQLLGDEVALQSASEAARNYVYAKRGATEKIMQFIQENRLLTN